MELRDGFARLHQESVNAGPNDLVAALLREAVKQPRCEPGVVAEFEAMAQTVEYSGAYNLLGRAAGTPGANAELESALKIQKTFRAQRFRLAEQAYEDGVKIGAQWIHRFFKLPKCVSRVVAEFVILGSLPNGLPVLIHRRDGHFVLSFPQDLSLSHRREYAKQCSHSVHPALRLSTTFLPNELLEAHSI